MLARKSALPHCAVAFAPSLTRDEFMAELYASNKDFARTCCPIWSKYRSDVIKPWARSSRRFRALGVQVVLPATFQAFSEAFKPCREVVVLVAHWGDSCVEFSDGTVPYHRVAEAIPPGWRGILDLCVCHPDGLAKELKAKNSTCIVRYSNRRASLDLWLKVYEGFFTTMVQCEIDYLDAVERFTVALRRTSERSSQ